MHGNLYTKIIILKRKSDNYTKLEKYIFYWSNLTTSNTYTSVNEFTKLSISIFISIFSRIMLVIIIIVLDLVSELLKWDWYFL